MRYRGISQATSNWVSGLMRGVESAGGSITAFAHVQSGLWPKGNLFPGRQEDLEPSVSQVLVRYGNIPGIRRIWLSKAIVRAIKKHIKRHGVPDVLFTYNLYPHYVDAAKAISETFGVPWIPIILDLDDPEPDNWSEFNRLAKPAAGAIFLSWWGYCNAPCHQKLHLDSGGRTSALGAVAKQDRAVKNIVYAGKFTDYGGTGLLVETIKKVQDQDVRFILCGKGDAEPLKELARTDKRVVIKGFVSDEELALICGDADVFINPRPLEFQDSKMIFPSKILFYLEYGVPIVSTWTPGLSPDYREVLVVPEHSDAESLARSISQVLGWTDIERNEYKSRTDRFLAKRTWAWQGKRLLDFVSDSLECST